MADIHISMKLSDILRSLWNVNDNLKNLNSNLKKNDGSEKVILESLSEVLKSNQRIEELLIEQVELKKYELGLPSKINGIYNKNRSNLDTNHSKGRVIKGKI